MASTSRCTASSNLKRQGIWELGLKKLLAQMSGTKRQDYKKFNSASIVEKAVDHCDRERFRDGSPSNSTSAKAESMGSPRQTSSGQCHQSGAPHLRTTACARAGSVPSYVLQQVIPRVKAQLICPSQDGPPAQRPNPLLATSLTLKLSDMPQ